MEAEQRKNNFVALLEQLLIGCNGVKGKLSEKLTIKPSTLTGWLQGKTDPASIEVLMFDRIANAASISTDELVKKLGIIKTQKNSNRSQEQLKILIEQMLSKQSQEQLGNRLGVTQTAISGWINPAKKVEPGKISITTMAAIATECGWTIERLLIYLNLKQPQSEKDLFFQMQSNVTTLSLNDRVKLLALLTELIEQEINQFQTSKKTLKKQQKKDYSLTAICNISIVLEKEDLALASNYANNLGIHFQIPADNITIATITQFEEVKKDFDLIIFDIETNSSNTIDRVNQISFDGDIVIFTSPELEEEVRSQLEDKVTDIVVKPIDWLELKNKPYFS